MEPRNLWPDFSEFSAEFNIWPTRTFLPWRGERRIFATRVHGVTSTCTLRFLPSLDLCKRAVCTRTSQTFVKSTGCATFFKNFLFIQYGASIFSGSFLLDMDIVIERGLERLTSNRHLPLFSKVFAALRVRWTTALQIASDKTAGMRRVFARWSRHLCLQNYRNNWN